MHILYVSNNFPRPNEPGVPRPWQMTMHWISLGYKVTVIMNARHYMKVRDETDTNSRQKFIRSKHENGLDIKEVLTTKGRRRSLAHRILNYVSFTVMALFAGITVRNVDIVYTRTPPILINISGYILSLLKRAIFILEIGDLHPDESVALGFIKNPILIEVWEIWENFFRSKAKLIVAVVPGIKRLLKKKGISDKKIIVVTNAYDPLIKQADKGPFFDFKYIINAKDYFLIAYAGSMGKAIPLEYTLDAARIIQSEGYDQIQFVYIGDGDNRARLQQKCQREDVRNCIFLDPIPSSQVTLLLSQMDVLFHVIQKGEFHGYNLPNKIFTYLGSKKPIIYAGTGDVAEIINEAKCGIVVVSGEPDMFANAVKDLYLKREALEEMGRRGYEYVTKHYNRIQILNNLAERLIKAAYN